VDSLEDVAEIVVRGLGVRLKRVRFASAAAVLPTGKVALLLSASEVVREALGRTPEAVLAAALAVAAPERRKRLLLVEDSVTTRALERSILEAAGYDVIAAADGAEAWEELQAQGADLVVADVEMPRMDGIALTEAIRSSKRFRDLPVILVTAMESDRDRGRGIEAGADAYILKSTFDQRKLLETIGQLL
jgi:two-component system chemotaxis sensor kinase CheA